MNENHLKCPEKYIFGSISIWLTEPTIRESWCSTRYKFGRIFGGLEGKGGSLMSELIITTGKHQKFHYWNVHHECSLTTQFYDDDHSNICKVLDTLNCSKNHAALNYLHMCVNFMQLNTCTIIIHHWKLVDRNRSIRGVRPGLTCTYICSSCSQGHYNWECPWHSLWDHATVKPPRNDHLKCHV